MRKVCRRMFFFVEAKTIYEKMQRIRVRLDCEQQQQQQPKETFLISISWIIHPSVMSYLIKRSKS